MTVEQLIDALKNASLSTEVMAWGFGENYEDVTGIEWADDGSTILIMTYKEP